MFEHGDMFLRTRSSGAAKVPINQELVSEMDGTSNAGVEEAVEEEETWSDVSI
jgi:hypothetical protein